MDDFVVDHAGGIVTCPVQVTGQITLARQVVFGKACTERPFKDRYRASATGRILKLTEHDELLHSHRQAAANPDFQAVYRRHRPMVERSIAWLT